MSSLAFGGQFDDGIASALLEEGICGIEIAPTAIWGSDGYPTSLEVAEVRRRWAEYGFHIPAIQSLLYGRDELALFDADTWPALSDHLMRMADIASHLGAAIMVFGSPRNRLKGDLDDDAAVSMARRFLSDLASKLKGSGLAMTLEPNPADYGADFMTTYDEVLAVVDAVDSPSIRPQIDTGCLHLSGDDPAASVARRTPAHVHISAPGLGLVPGEGVDHRDVADRLRSAGYEGWLTVEMLHDRIDGLGDVRRGAHWCASVYGQC